MQELPHEELLQVDKVTLSDYLTEEEYDNILEILGKVRLLLEEITANYARWTIEIGSTHELCGMSNSNGNVLYSEQQSS